MSLWTLLACDIIKGRQGMAYDQCHGL